MTTATKRSHKHFQLDSAKIKRAQRALRAKTETEAIERALDLAIAEHDRRLVYKPRSVLSRVVLKLGRLRHAGCLDAARTLRHFHIYSRTASGKRRGPCPQAERLPTHHCG